MSDGPDRKRGKGASLSGSSEGRMGEEYAKERERSRALIFRYKCRAAAAVWAWRRYHGHETPNRILELGTADGRTLMEIRRLFDERGSYDGMEVSAELLAHAPSGLDNVRFLSGDAMQFPAEVRGQRYSLVTALALLEHLEQPFECLEQSISVMEEGGVMVASCPHPSWDTVAGRFGLVRDEHHVQRMNAERLKKLMRAAGFRRVLYVPFMLLPIAALPYFGLQPSVHWSMRVDEIVRSMGNWTRPMFVNQLVAGIKEAE